MRRTFRIASAQITHEVIDGEVMIVNLENGVYYNLTGSGAKVWVWMQQEGSTESVLHNFLKTYQVEREPAEGSLLGFFGELEREGLITSHASHEAASPPHPEENTSENRLSFEPPVLNKYTDMQELLLLDPIHDVDPAGWPRIKQG